MKLFLPTSRDLLGRCFDSVELTKKIKEMNVTHFMVPNCLGGWNVEGRKSRGQTELLYSADSHVGLITTHIAVVGLERDSC